MVYLLDIRVGERRKLVIYHFSFLLVPFTKYTCIFYYYLKLIIHDQVVGDLCRAGGEVALVAQKKSVAINRKQRLLEKLLESQYKLVKIVFKRVKKYYKKNEDLS